jgi:hypothetical protein
MEEITAEQFLEGAKAWDPGEDFADRVVERLRVSGAPEETVEPLGRAFQACSRATYDYIEYIHELATAKEIGRQDLLPVAARLVALVQGLQASGRTYREAFRDFDALTRGGLSQDHFDTVYYDAIQNIELRVLLKKVITEVEALLQSFSLVSGELSKVKCVDLYEASIRLQLFLQYFLTKERFSNEELWSVLFDVFNQMGEMEGVDLESSAEELRDLHEKIQKFRTN